MFDSTNRNSCPEMWPIFDHAVTSVWPQFDPSLTSATVLKCSWCLATLWPQFDLILPPVWFHFDLVCLSCPEMWPVFCRSKTLNASRISSSESVLWIFFAIMLRNSGKSTVPLPARRNHATTSDRRLPSVRVKVCLKRQNETKRNKSRSSVYFI